MSASAGTNSLQPGNCVRARQSALWFWFSSLKSPIFNI